MCVGVCVCVCMCVCVPGGGGEGGCSHLPVPMECLRLPLRRRLALCDELLLVDVRVLLRLGLGRAPLHVEQPVAVLARRIHLMTNKGGDI